MMSSLDRLLQQATGMLSEVGTADNTNSFDQTQNLIDMVRYSLSFPNQQLGVWETMELNAASSALEAGFLKLAITFACRAIEVNKLQEIEYLFGFEAVRHHHDEPAYKVPKDHSSAALSHKHDARDLLWLQNTTAISLLQGQLSRAKDLTLQQKLAAESLVLMQKKAAEQLVADDGTAAKSLMLTQRARSATINLAMTSDGDIVREKDIKLFMRWGDYSVGQNRGRGRDAGELLKEDKGIALKLKEQQKLRAQALQVEQKDAAMALADNDKAGSARLKSLQKKEAIILKETNVLKALLKKQEPGVQGAEEDDTQSR